MPKGFSDIYIDRNADFDETWIYTDSDDTPINLTDFSFQGQIKERAKDETALIDFVITVDTPLAGEINLYISQADCETLLATIYPNGTPKNYVYDIIIEDGAGIKTVFISGEVIVSDGVTEWA